MELPLVAVVIAAYNEEGAVAPVVESLPGQCAGSPRGDRGRGQVFRRHREGSRPGGRDRRRRPGHPRPGATPRLGYRISKEGGPYIAATDADGRTIREISRPRWLPSRRAATAASPGGADWAAKRPRTRSAGQGYGFSQLERVDHPLRRAWWRRWRQGFS